MHAELLPPHYLVLLVVVVIMVHDAHGALLVEKSVSKHD
jgi:hypothetical protein